MTGRLGAAGLGCTLVVVATSVSACGSSGVTHAALETSFQQTFARLYQLQQRDRGRPVELAALHSRAACSRGTVPQTPGAGPAAVSATPSGSGSGAAPDWTCLVTFLIDPSSPVQAKFSVAVKPDGCYTADGDGPTEINGEQTLVTPDGRTLVNPLWRFDGCFDEL